MRLNRQTFLASPGSLYPNAFGLLGETHTPPLQNSKTPKLQNSNPNPNPDTMASQEYIEIRGARENNLKDVSLRIPKRKITIFTGVSGSGKSSIVFDTVATEAQRQMNENFSMFIRTFLPRYSQPDADAIENLSMPIVVDQK